MVSDTAKELEGFGRDPVRVLITGGSGFIGTNLVQKYVEHGYDVTNIDINTPRNTQHFRNFLRCDILNRSHLEKVFAEFRPNYVFHLAARTDLDGAGVEDYAENIEGVQNVLDCIKHSPDVRAAIFVSSMLVCRHGSIPNTDDEYFPDTDYGKSKVLGEKLVRDYGLQVPWCILRPTSIWGPWFSVPYISFFKSVRKGLYVHPKDQLIERSYGYVENIVAQMMQVMERLTNGELFGRTYYLADYQPINVKEWADQISEAFGGNRVREIPLPVLRTIAYVGDALRMVGWRNPPLYSRRLRNLTTASVIGEHWHPPVETGGAVPMPEAVRRTVVWMKDADCT